MRERCPGSLRSRVPSAKLIVVLLLTRKIAREVPDKLKHDRAAQITLARYGGRGLNTVRERCETRPDSFVHMLECYGQLEQPSRGAKASEFLALMAVRTKLSPPGVSRPFATDLRVARIG